MKTWGYNYWEDNRYRWVFVFADKRASNLGVERYQSTTGAKPGEGFQSGH